MPTPKAITTLNNVMKLFVKELLNSGVILWRLINIMPINTNKTKSLIKDCHGVKGMASPKQPHDVTTLKNAE